MVRIDGSPYTGLDLARVLAREPRFETPEQARAALAIFVDEILLSRNRDASAGDAETAKPRLAWLDAYAERLGLRPTVGDADVVRHYEAHRSSYVRPMQVRLSVLALPDTGSSRHAHSLYLQAQMSPSRVSFGGYLRDRDRHFRARDVGLVACDGSEASGVPLEVVRSACATREGELLPPMRVGDTWYLVRNDGIRPGRNVSLAAAKGEIRRLLETRAQREARERAIAHLRSQTHVEIADGAIDALVARGPARPAPAWPPRPDSDEGPPRVPGGGS